MADREPTLRRPVGLRPELSAWSPDGRWLAKRVTVASYLTGELLGHYPGHGRDANVFLLSTDECTLLTVDYANSVRTWRLNL